MKFIVGNWKMNGTGAELKNMISVLEKIKTKNKIILCVPFTLLDIASGKIALGAQDISTHSSGAYTGEVSGKMIAETGAKYVLVGHSERRKYHKETNAIVRQKADQAIANNLVPIICIGETGAEKRAGKTEKIIENGVRESVPKNSGKQIMIAYEPRWAIGKGVTPGKKEISKVITLIEKTLKSLGFIGVPILYGGSVNRDNIAKILSIPNVDGVLVGNSSLKQSDFIPIITTAE